MGSLSQNLFTKGSKMNLATIASLSVGQHLYWRTETVAVHGETLLTSWFILGLLGIVSIAGNSNLKSIPEGLQNVTEFSLEFIRDIAKTQIGEEEHKEWVPFIGTIFLFIFVSNWSGALLPWRVIELPNGELGAPTNDINTTAPFLLPINVLEDFTKPLSLCFRLFGNILADELVVGVLLLLVPLLVPVPLMLLGLFTSAIQALVFATLAGAYIGESLEDHH